MTVSTPPFDDAVGRDAIAQAFAMIEDGAVVFNRERVVVFANAAWLEMHGSSSADSLLVDDFLPQELSVPEVAQFWSRLEREGQADALLPHKRADGSTFLSQTRVRTARRDGGAGASSLYVMVALPCSDASTPQSFLESIVENIPDMVFVKEAEQLRFVLFNRAGENLLGYPRAELLGKNDYDLFPREQADFFTAKDREVLGGPSVVEIPEEPIHTKNGLRWLHTKKIPIIDARGVARYLLGIAEDITERKRIAEALDRAARDQRIFADAAQATASTLDFGATVRETAQAIVPELADGCLLFVADGPLELRHRVPRSAESAQQLTADIVPALRRLYEQNDAALDSSASQEVLLKLGACSAIIAPLQARGRGFGLAILWHDDSERSFDERDTDLANRLLKRAACDIDNARIHADLERAEALARDALRARDEFLSVASHELRTPLTALQLHVDGLAKRSSEVAPSDERFRKRLAQAGRQVGRLTHLVTGLLDLSRIAAGTLALQREPMNLATLAAEAVDALKDSARGNGCTLELHAPDQPVGAWDASRVEQVITNLVTNAIKYARDGAIMIDVTSTAAGAVLAVSDEGPGVPSDRMHLIFERFERGTSAPASSGLGLGLFIARQIVVAHGGTLTVENKPTGGARFVATLPFDAGGERYNPQVAPSEAALV